MKYYRFLLFPLLFLLLSCHLEQQQTDVGQLFVNVTKKQSLVRYATQFDLYQKNGVTKIDIYDPGDHQKIQASYYIASTVVYDQYKKDASLFKSPVDSVALFSATQINAFQKLGLLGKIVGVSEAGYINDTFVRHQIENGHISELAGSGNLYIEKTLMVDPSIIFYSPSQAIESRSADLAGIALISYYDYLEEDPLGRAEWIKFSAVFFGLYHEADSLFNDIVHRYGNYRDMVKTVKSRPTVFSDKYFNGQWYIPGGQSYIANLFTDAGASYIWRNDKHKGSFPLDYEVVYEKAHNADYWRIVGSYGEKASYESLAEQNELYRHFKAFKNHRIIWCDAESTAYFEESPLEPDRVLADLIKAFHPELLPAYKPKYYWLLP